MHCSRVFIWSRRLFCFPTLYSSNSHSWHSSNPWREYSMRTFHPFSSSSSSSSPHMPDPAPLDPHLQPQLKSESPRPSSPALTLPNSNPISTPPDQPSSSNGISHLSHSTLTAAAPAVLSNQDPNASIQSILAASSKDKVLQQSDLHPAWTMHTISPSVHHHTVVAPQVCPFPGAYSPPSWLTRFASPSPPIPRTVSAN